MVTTEKQGEANALAKTLMESMGDLNLDGPGVPGAGDDDYELMGETSQYGPWIDLLKYAMDGDTSNILKSFKGAAESMTEQQAHLAMEMVHVGRIQEKATCANRIGKLRELEMMQELLSIYGETGAFPDDQRFEESMGTQMSIAKAEIRDIQTKHIDHTAEAYKQNIADYVEVKREAISEEIQIVSGKMAREDAAGVSVDYTKMKAMYQSYKDGISGPRVEELLREIPSGLHRAYIYMGAKTKGSPDSHSEALVAKVVANAGNVLSKDNQKRGRRRRRYSEYDEGDEGGYF